MFNTVEITPDQLANIVKFCYKQKSPLLILGRPGVGKTETVREFAEENNLRFVDIRLSLRDRGDFVIPVVDQESKTIRSYLTNLIPFDETPTLLFFDELTNAPQDIQKMIFSIVLERTLDGRKLHPNTYVLAAGNTVEDGCNVYDPDPALIDRFTVLKVTHDIQGFLRRAIQKEAAPEVITFLKLKPEYLYGPFINGQLPDAKYLYGTPRSWLEISTFLKANASKEEQGILIPGRIGVEAYAEFRHVIDEMGELPPIEDFLNAKTDKEILRLLKPIKSLNALYGLAYSLLPYCKDKKSFIQAIKIFNCLVQIKDNQPRSEIQRMGMEVLLVKSLECDDVSLIEELYETPEYLQYMEENEALMNMLDGKAAA